MKEIYTYLHPINDNQEVLHHFLQLSAHHLLIECVMLRLLVTDSTKSENRSQTQRHASTKDMVVL